MSRRLGHLEFNSALKILVNCLIRGSNRRDTGSPVAYPEFTSKRLFRKAMRGCAFTQKKGVEIFRNIARANALRGEVQVNHACCWSDPFPLHYYESKKPSTPHRKYSKQIYSTENFDKNLSEYIFAFFLRSILGANLITS
jgi:hypothetical protein